MFIFIGFLFKKYNYTWNVVKKKLEIDFSIYETQYLAALKVAKDASVRTGIALRACNPVWEICNRVEPFIQKLDRKISFHINDLLRLALFEAFHRKYS